MGSPVSPAVKVAKNCCEFRVLIRITAETFTYSIVSQRQIDHGQDQSLSYVKENFSFYQKCSDQEASTRAGYS